MEDFVSFDQAVKFKELGFDWKCNHLYPIESPNNIFGISDYYSEAVISDTILDPTLSQAQKWLREKHKLWLEPVICIQNINLYSCDI